MNRTIRTVATIAMVSLTFQVRLAAGPKGVKPAKTTHAPVVKTTAGPAVKPVKSAKTGAPATMKSAKPTTKAEVKAAKVTAKSAKVTAKADAKVAKSATKADAKAAKHSSTNDGTTSDSTSGTTSTTDTGSTTTPTVVSNPIADKISRNPNLAAKIASRLPADMTLAQASTGFRNQGQFIAAANVSKNLGIDFVKLQTAMTGQTVKVDPMTQAITTTPTGDAPLSLGRAIQTLKPGVDADAAVQKAQTQTSQMVQ